MCHMPSIKEDIITQGVPTFRLFMAEKTKVKNKVI